MPKEVKRGCPDHLELGLQVVMSRHVNGSSGRAASAADLSHLSDEPPSKFLKFASSSKEAEEIGDLLRSSYKSKSNLRH